MATTTEYVVQVSDEMYFVATSSVMRKLRTQAELLAQVNAPVLIVGESGTGKEVAARLIHKLSSRSAWRFMNVNCSALPADLLESELFGCEPGAFAGARRAKPGKLEICDKGTILLDEVTDLPAHLQAKLLDVLQNKQLVRMGGETPIEVDVRILASTSHSIEHHAERKLREDLYYRLSGFTIQVPPLRQRREDIPVLLTHFMQQSAEQFGLPSRAFSADVLDACQSYAWPGNVRELENFVKRHVVIGDEDVAVLELERNRHVGQEDRVLYMPKQSSAGVEVFPDPSAPSLKSLIRNVKGEAERNAIATALEQTRWNRKAAARLLKVSYRTLLYKIEQYRMTPSGYPSPYLSGDQFKGNGHGGD